LRVNAAVASAEADRASAESRLEVAQARLARLIGIPVDEARAATLDSLRPTGVTPPSRDSALAQARMQSPLVRVATSRTAAAEAAARAARAAWAPTVRIDSRLVSYGSGSGEYSTEWQTGARVSWPVFTGGGRGAAIERAEAAAREALALQRETELGIANEVDRTLAALTESSRRIAALMAAVGHLTEAQRVEALALAQGAGTQADFLRAEADLATARSGLAQARAAWIAARGELARLTGTLSPDRLAEVASGSAVR
jgi:outer membrane protein